MKHLFILICLLFIGGGLLSAQETYATTATTETPPVETPVTEDTELNQESTDTSNSTSEETTESSESSNAPTSQNESGEGEDSEDSKDVTTDDYYTEDETFFYKMNQSGDQFIKIGLMVDIPFKPKLGQLKVGGSGTLGYMYFLTSNFALGGDASFVYMTTIGDNIFTTIPLMIRAMYQFSFHKFEIPITVGIGGAFENYNSDMYFGLIIKPEVGFFYRHSPSWSFGVNVGLNLMPQWAKDDSYFGLIMDTGITARYHF